VLQRQDAMHAALSELEKEVEAKAATLPERPSERQQAYELAEALDRETGEMRALVDATVQRLNTRRQAAEAPDHAAEHLSQMVHVLDVHLHAFQWLDSQADTLDLQLRQVNALVGDAVPLQSMHD